MMFEADDGGGISNKDLCVSAFVAIGCHRGGHVSHDREVTATKLSPRELVRLVDRKLWDSYCVAPTSRQPSDRDINLR